MIIIIHIILRPSVQKLIACFSCSFWWMRQTSVQFQCEIRYVGKNCKHFPPLCPQNSLPSGVVSDFHQHMKNKLYYKLLHKYINYILNCQHFEPSTTLQSLLPNNYHQVDTSWWWLLLYLLGIQCKTGLLSNYFQLRGRPRGGSELLAWHGASGDLHHQALQTGQKLPRLPIFVFWSQPARWVGWWDGCPCY